MFYSVATRQSSASSGGRMVRKDAASAHTGLFEQVYNGDMVFRHLFLDGGVLIFETRDKVDAFVNHIYGVSEVPKVLDNFIKFVSNAVVAKFGEEAGRRVVSEVDKIKKGDNKILFLKVLYSYLKGSINHRYINQKPDSPEAVVCRDALLMAVRLGTFTTASAPASAAVSQTVVVAPPVIEPPVAVDLPVEEAPVVEETPVVEEAPVVEETPVVEEAPAVDETPVVEEAPVIEEAPAVDETPVVEEAPVIEEAPAADETPVVEEDPVVDSDKPVMPPEEMSIPKLKEWCEENLPEGTVINFKNNKKKIREAIEAVIEKM